MANNGPDLAALLGVPVTVTSGKRSPQHNALVGGVPNSDHLTDRARDFIPQGMSMADAAAKAKQSGKFTKVLNEGDHVHVSYNQGNAVPQVSDDDLLKALTGGQPSAAVVAAHGDPHSISDDQLLKALTTGGNDAPAKQVVAPTAKANQPKPSTLADIVHTLPGALVKGASYVAGLPGDFNSMLDAGANMLTGANVSTNHSLPTSSGIQKAVSEPFGGFYEPKTTPGKYADTIAQFAPAALGPGGAVTRIARAAVPGAASEAAGEATQGTPYEGAARFGGALLGGMALGVKNNLIGGGPKEILPTTKDLKTASQGAYKAAEQAGVVVKPEAMASLGKDIQSAVTDAGIDPTLHPKAMAAVKRITDAKGEITLKGLDILRRVANGAAGSMDKDESRIAHIVLDHIDDFVENLGDHSVLSGDAEAASSAIKDARALWAKQAKSAAIDELLERAKNRADNIGGSGYENALRVEFRQLAQNPKRLRKFSQDEQEAIRDVARGRPGQNFARMLGKLSPTSGVIPSLGSLAAVAAEPVTGLILPAVGMTGKALSTAATIKNAKRASEMVRRGGPAADAPQTFTPELLSALLARQKQEQGNNNNALVPSFGMAH